jgi:YidC/Oxa1 family membrane protein insertase
MEKRVLIAVLLSLVVLLLWGKIFPPPKLLPAPVQGKPAASAQAVAPAAPAQGVPAQAQAQAAAMPEGSVAAAAEQKDVLENEYLALSFTNKGAQLLSVKLKKFFDLEGHPLEMVPSFRPGSYPLDTLFEKNADLQAEASGALYQVEKNGPALTFRYASPTLGITREIRLNGAFLSFRQDVRTPSPAPWALRLGPGLRSLDEQERSNRFLLAGNLAYLKAGSLTRATAAKIKEPLDIGPEGLSYVGLEDNFFTFMILPQKGLGTVRALQDTNTWRGDVLTARPRLEDLPEGLKDRAAWDAGTKTLSLMGVFTPSDQAEMTKVCVNDADGKRIGRILLKDPAQISMTAAAAGAVLETSLYIGAKDYDFLKREKPELTELINFGMFSLVSKFFLFILKWMYGVVHNYGVAIILLTVLLRIALYPINQKQMVSMKKMQAIQPKVEAIKRKYKKAPKDMEERNRMNQEIMALYKAEGVNPAGGCLPLLIQLPILWAFYSLLSAAIELRHAPFMLWIHDLSSKDPYYVTPVLMGAAMFLQQKMTPMSGSDMQKKIYLLLPIMFTYMFLHFPSGMVLYWLMNTLLQLAQTWWYQRREQKEAA